MKILIAGLSGTGKTTLADLLLVELLKDYSCTRLNADVVRSETNNWDFSLEGRMKQAYELTSRARVADSNIVICDFIAPTAQVRNLFDADYTVWMNTALSSTYADTDALFEPFENADYIITAHTTEHIPQIISNIKLIISR